MFLGYKNKTGRQNGNIAFYALFILPIVMVMLMIVIDVSHWQALREEARRHADRIVLETAQYLPSKQDAEAVFQSQANFFNQSNNLNLTIDASAAEVSNRVRPSSINVNVAGSVESGFDYFLQAFTGSGTVFPINETASARLLPTDLVLIVSDSVNLRPPAPTLWGSQLDWPQSEYFNFILPPTVSIDPSPQPPLAWSNWWSPVEFVPNRYMKFATQLCYNPVVMPLKHASLLVLDAISVNEENRLAVYVTPGDIPSSVVGGAGYTILKDYKYVDEPNSLVTWSNYFEPDIAHSDEACVLYAHPEANNSRYNIPDSTTWTSPNSCPQVVLSGLFTDPRGHYPNPYLSYVSDCFKQGGMSIREAIYYHGVRRNQHEVSLGNISRSIFQALTTIVETEKITTAANTTKRRGLVRDSSKVVLLISETLPLIASPDMQRAIALVNEVSNLKIYLVGYYAAEMPVAIQQELVLRQQEYQNLLNERIQVEIAGPSDIQDIVVSIINNEKKVVLSS